MKVKVDISNKHNEPYVEIHTDRMTDEIQRIIDHLDTGDTPIIGSRREDDLAVIRPEEIYMVRVEDGQTLIYTRDQQYRSRKRLYELMAQLGNRFMQISKGTAINLSYIDSIEPGFGGSLLLKLKNGSKDYVSRTYLKGLKRYLGL